MWFYVSCAVLLWFAALAVFYWLIPRPRHIKNLSGKHALITGGSSGIGLETAKVLAAKGCIVSIIARNESRLDDAKRDVIKSAPSATVHTLSLELSGDYASVSSKLLQFVDVVGTSVDILVNCAGVCVAREFATIEPAEIVGQMNANYVTAAHCTRVLLPSMLERGSGAVVFVSSQAGQLGLFGFGAYSPSKFALRGLAESLYMEIVPRGLTVSLVHPADTDTPGYAAEQLGKPAETIAISNTAGLVSPNIVAENLLRGVCNGEFLISNGVDGWLLSRLTSGLSAPTNLFNLYVECCLLGVMRFIAVVLNYQFHSVIRSTPKCKTN